MQWNTQRALRNDIKMLVKKETSMAFNEIAQLTREVTPPTDDNETQDTQGTATGSTRESHVSESAIREYIDQKLIEKLQGIEATIQRSLEARGAEK